MKKLCVMLLFSVLMTGSAGADMLGVGAPDFTLKDLDGKVHSLSDYAGKIVLLFHFNTYCHSCREEVPQINMLQKQYPDVVVLGIATANDNQETRDFKKSFKAEFTLVPDPKKEVFRKYFVSTIPLIDIIDRSGTIRYRGKLPGEKRFAAIMQEIVDEKEVVGSDLWNKPPDFTLKTSEGKTFSLQDSIGKKTIMLTFMSVQDETTRQVVEIMKTVYRRYKREDLEMVRIAVNDSARAVNAFKKKYYVDFPILVDKDGSVAEKYGVKTLSRTFIINKKGKIRFIIERISLTNLESILVKVKSYFKEELPEEIVRTYLRRLIPEAERIDKVTLSVDNEVYIGTTQDKKKILARRVFKDVLCDVCTNVHYVYSFDMKGTVKNIVLIESIDLYGMPIEAQDYLQRVIKQASRKQPVRFRKDIDAISGATQSCKLILEGINETPEVLKAIKAYKNILAVETP